MTEIITKKTKKLGTIKMILICILSVIVVTIIIAIALPKASNDGQENPNTAINQPQIESTIGD